MDENTVEARLHEYFAICVGLKILDPLGNEMQHIISRGYSSCMSPMNNEVLRLHYGENKVDESSLCSQQWDGG